MQSFSITTSNPQQGPKNYVFVDEHNRHKRLKVMRACEGCRRRKIRCDSATTNTWPCAACQRLKLHCVPPAGGIDGDFDQPLDPSQQNSFSQSNYATSFSSDAGHHYENYNQYDPRFQKGAYFQPEESYNGIYNEQQYNHSAVDPYQLATPGLPAPRSDSDTQLSHSSDTPAEQKLEGLSQHLGDLQITETGIAPYARGQKTNAVEADVPIREIEEAAESKVDKAFKTDAGSHIRIPPALMPSDDDAMDLFDVFFREIHPYTPVLNRQQFYHQWHTDKESISPLVLEAVFACAGRIAEEPSEGAQWLALSSKHEQYFLDTPRLSTVQALLLLLKAREGAPKRGYYYRSWMTVKTIVTMAKDLELHEHHEIHENGDDCGSDPAECLSKTRVWQTALICEMMVGGSQGRSDMGVDPSSIDISPNPPNSSIDSFEASISRQFAFFLRNARNIRFIADVAQKTGKKKDGDLVKELMSHNAAFHKWPDDLPEDLQIIMPNDGSPPVLSSHFIANMHIHYRLGIVMLRRPQLVRSDKFAEDPTWRGHMSVCHESAKILCRLQEAVLAQYGLNGLVCMQRGISFTIYAVLTCVMIHLIAITAPDPEWHADARDYFTRQMRILERCTEIWRVPETIAQINGLRAAFSADLSKPFDLKSTFPLGTPEAYQPSPTHQSQPNGGIQYQPQVQPHPAQQQLHIPSQPYLPQQITHLQQQSYLATPPVSAVSNDSKPHSPHFQPPYDPNINHAQPYIPNATFYQQPTPTEPSTWNPTPIIDQFNTAFAIPPSALQPPTYNSPPGYNPSPPYPTAAAYPPPQPQYYNPQHQYIDSSSPMAAQQMHLQQQQQQPTQQSARPSVSDVYAGNNMVYVTPKEWQQSVASVFDPGLKRRWVDYAAGMDDGGGGGGGKRR